MAYQILLVDDIDLSRCIKSISKDATNSRWWAKRERRRGGAVLQTGRPDLVLMDIGCQAERHRGHHRDHAALPDCKVIILRCTTTRVRWWAIRSGARAFVLKSASSDDLLDACARSQGGFIFARGGRPVQTRIQRRLSPSAAPGAGYAIARELQVLRLVAEQDQQGDRRHAGPGLANGAQLPQDQI